MGKRQVIYGADRIAGNSELLNREINLVTRESRVWHGRVASLDHKELVLKDARSGKHRFPIEQIDRIYRDVTTQY